MNQTAHISLQLLSISNSVEDKSDWMRPNFFGAPRLDYLWYSYPPRCRVARLAPRCGVSVASVRGVLRLVSETRNPFFREKCIFCDETVFSYVFRWLRQDNCASTPRKRNFIRQEKNNEYNILGYPPIYPQEAMRLLRKIHRNRT